MADVNTDYIGGLDGQTSIVSDLMGGAVASVADFGVSVFNSLVPESYEASTADLLRNVSSNALRVYNEHPDAVKTASFVGGVFVPAGLAVKGLNTLRAGAKGASWFATEQRAANLVKLEELAAAGPAKTEAFKALRRQIHMNDLANIGVDIAVSEAAIVMAMNDHPFMEDYLDDPVKHFGLSMAVGGVIGGGITHIASRAAVRAAEGRAQAGALAPILDAIKPVPEGMPSVTSLAVRQANIDALETLSKTTDKEGSLLTDYASKMLVKERTLQEQEFQGLVSGMKNMPEDYMAELKNMLYTDPRFEGLDAVKPFIVKESVAGKNVKGLKIDKDFGDLYEVEVGTGKEVSKARILIPEADGFGTIADVNSLGRATAMGVTESNLVKSSSGVIGKHITPDQDAGLAIRGASSPVVDKMYAERLAVLDNAKEKFIAEAAVAPDDLPTLNALISRVRRDRNTNPDAYRDAKFTIRSAGETTEVDFDGLVGIFQRGKEEQIQSFMREGRSSLEVSIRTNTPKETIEKWAANGYTGPLSTYGADSSYSTASMLSEYLHPRTQPLKVSSNIRQKSWADMQSSLDRRSMDIMNDQIIKTYFERNANTPLVKAIYDLLHTDEMDKVKELARMDLNKVTNANAGTKWIQTSDFWAKNMGNFGAVMAYLGKHVEDIGNHAMNRMLQPISKHLEAVALDKAATVEMNLAKQVYDSTPGYALYKDRQWYTKVERTVEENGKATKKIVLEPVKYQGEAFIVKSDAVDEVLKGFHSVGRELYSTKGTVNGILGRAAMHDRGTWMPSINPRDKHLGYVVNHAEGTTKLLWGNTAEELEKAKIAYEAAHRELIDNKTMQIFTKAQQADYSLYNGRLDTMTMEIANVEKFHKGSSATAIVKNTTDLFGELIGGIEHSVQSNVRQLVEISLHDISANLRRMSEINQVYSANQPLSKVLKGIHQPQDAAKNARNMMLGLKDLPDYTSWDNLNTGFEATTGLLLNKITDVWNTVKGKSGGIFSKNKPVDYEEYKRLAAEAGMVDPYKAFGDAAEEFYALGGLQADKNQVRRIISTANNFAATSALKFAEIAHPIVNAMSLPILMTAGIADKMPANFLGASLKGKINPMEAMANGVRAMNSGKFNHWEKIWVERGYLDSIVSEATKVLKIPREFDPGIIAATERALDSKFVEFFSKGANWSEQLVRKTAMHTGAQMAKRLYPDLSDTGVTIFARNFMDKVVGNYHASQRPVFFQGTMGTALGLFQTYMLTFGQNMYRQLELKNYKALGKTMLAQGTIFGARSMPGFQPISEMIGEHYSDDHTDLMSGTIRAMDDDLAKAILFGLPSSMGPAMYTRGELTPRVTTPLDLTGIPAVNMVGQTVGAIGRVAQAVAVDGESMPRAIGQALSLQSVSRPLARMSELATGTSITAAGNTVQTPDEVWSTTGVIARLLGTRPTEEAILRESDMVRRVYDSYDREARQKVLKKLKLYVRDGNLTEENMAELAADYLDEGGTPRGWQSAINQAILEAQTGMLPSVRDKLKPNNSLNHVIDMLDD